MIKPSEEGRSQDKPKAMALLLSSQIMNAKEQCLKGLKSITFMTQKG